MENRYSGRCECGAHVPAGAGVASCIDGTWHVFCSEHEPRRAAPSQHGRASFRPRKG